MEFVNNYAVKWIYFKITAPLMSFKSNNFVFASNNLAVILV